MEYILLQKGVASKGKVTNTVEIAAWLCRWLICQLARLLA